MAYCEVADVEKLMGAQFPLSGRPSKEDVEQMIADAAADLDGVAQAAGYDTPVTGISAVALMKRYNTCGAAVAAWHAGYVSEAEPARVEYWRTEYRDFITRLRKGEQDLPGETSASDLDAAFDIVPATRRDPYWTTGQEL